MRNRSQGFLAYATILDNPQVSAWRFSIYGGLMLGGGDPTVRSGSIGVLTGPRRVQERAGLAVKWLHGRAAGSANFRPIQRSLLRHATRPG